MKTHGIVAGIVAVLLGVASASHAGHLGLTILFDPDAPQRGIAVLSPGSHDTRLILAERISFTHSGDGVTVAVENGRMLTRDDMGTRVIAAEQLPFRFSPDIRILVNGHDVSARDAARLYTLIPSQEASESSRRQSASGPSQGPIRADRLPSVPTDALYYSVQRGDTLSSVCELFLIDPEALRRANPDVTLEENLRGVRRIRIPVQRETEKQAEQKSADGLPSAVEGWHSPGTK